MTPTRVANVIDRRVPDWPYDTQSLSVYVLRSKAATVWQLPAVTPSRQARQR